jgi:hypothetical protein
MARVQDTTASPAAGSAADRLATSLVGRLVDVGIDGLGPLDPAHVVAEAARRSTGSVEAAVDDLVRSHTRLAAAGGFVTGLGGFVTLPVALPANVVGFYVVATRMVAGIAHLRGYDLQRAEVRTAVLLALVGVDAEQVLSRVGLRPLGGLRRLALRHVPQPALVLVNKAVAFRLLSQAGRTTLSRLGRGVPLAGGLIGAGLDSWLLRRIAAGAREELAPV